MQRLLLLFIVEEQSSAEVDRTDINISIAQNFNYVLSIWIFSFLSSFLSPPPRTLKRMTQIRNESIITSDVNL